MENNGKGIFYGVIGVATLIVAIIGATFAYFTATASNNNTVAGTAAQAGLTLEVTAKSANVEKPMVPQPASVIQTAVTGTNRNSCVDGNGNTVCKVYEVKVTNTGTSATVLYGKFTLSAETMTNLKWGKSTTSATEGFSATYAKSETDLVDPATAADQSITLQASGTAGDSTTFWIVVFIDETNASQNSTDTGSFTGTITFNSAEGSGVTSTFTAAA